MCGRDAYTTRLLAARLTRLVIGRDAAGVVFRLVRLDQRRTRALPAQMLQICSSSAGWA